MKKIIFILIFTLVIPFQLYAKNVVFVKDYTYDASEADSLLSCRAISLLQVKQLLLEELGMYLETETEVVNFQLSRDQVTVLSGGIVKTEIINEKWDGRTYRIKAKIESDPDEVAKSIDDLRKKRKIDKEVQKLTGDNEAALKRIQELREELATAQENLIQINRDYKNASKIITSSRWFETGLQLRREKKINEAINALNKAIELNPTYKSYVERGKTYNKSRKYYEAIRDFNAAIDLKPNYGKAYYYKGRSLIKLGRFKSGKKEIKKAARFGHREAKYWLKLKGIN